MGEKLRDLKEILLHDRRARAGIGLLLLSILFVAFCTTDKGRSFRDGGGEVVKENSFDNNQQNAYKELISAFREDVDYLKRANDDNQKFQKRIREDFERNQTKMADLLESIVDKQNLLDQEIRNLKAKPAPENEKEKSPDMVLPEQNLDSLETEGFVEDEIPERLKNKPQATKAAVITAGDAVRVMLLSGVNAPTDGTPYPVVFKLVGPITGPDGSTLDIGEARILAVAQGSEIDSRAIYRLKTLAVRHPDGRRSVVNIDGWIVGEDGVRGMQGQLIDKLGSFIIATLGTTFTTEVLNKLANGNRSVQVNNSSGVNFSGDDLSAAFTSSLNVAGERLVDVYISRLEKLIPVVEILAGREAAAVFSKTAEVYVCDTEDCSQEISTSTFASLD